jgi:hypothetical protein
MDLKDFSGDSHDRLQNWGWESGIWPVERDRRKKKRVLEVGH